jgi:hypothetical protein
MDAMGDADGWDDELQNETGPKVWTPEAQAFTAAGLVIVSLFSQGLFRFTLFFVDGDEFSAWKQSVVYSGPGAVLAAAGAFVGWNARRTPSTPTLRGLSVAAAVVGGVMALVAAAGVVAAGMTAPDGF